MHGKLEEVCITYAQKINSINNFQRHKWISKLYAYINEIHLVSAFCIFKHEPDCTCSLRKCIIGTSRKYFQHLDTWASLSRCLYKGETDPWESERWYPETQFHAFHLQSLGNKVWQHTLHWIAMIWYFYKSMLCSDVHYSWQAAAPAVDLGVAYME